MTRTPPAVSSTRSTEVPSRTSMSLRMASRAGMVELDAAHDDADVVLPYAPSRAVHAERHSPEGLVRDVHHDADATERLESASPDGARTDLVPRVALFLEDDRPHRDAERLLGEVERRRQAGRPAAHDDHVVGLHRAPRATQGAQSSDPASSAIS